MLYIFLRKKRYIIMKISTKGRYAMRLMLDLALNNTGAPISYVRSVRGAQGGYLLRKAPEEYTVGMILRLTEGSLAPVACLDEGDDVNCEKREDCVTLILWKKINDAICSVVDHITLQDLVDWQREKNGDYVI